MNACHVIPHAKGAEFWVVSAATAKPSRLCFAHQRQKDSVYAESVNSFVPYLN